MKWIGLFIMGLIVSAAAQHWMNAQRGAPAALEESLYLRSGETLKKASAGFDGLLADLYWIRTVQYFGRQLEQQRAARGELDVREMQLLEPLLNVTTELDPQHIAAYRFGGFFLQYNDPEKAARFLQSGIRNNPNEWRLYQDLGFGYWRQKRYSEAASAYERGSHIAGAPAWMRAMAASMTARAGDAQTAHEIFRRLCEGNDDKFIKEICGRQ